MEGPATWCQSPRRHPSGHAPPWQKIWKKWSCYHQRSFVETKMQCFKLLGERVMGRDFDRQVAKLRVRAAILNRFTPLGTPTTVVVPYNNSNWGLGNYKLC